MWQPVSSERKKPKSGDFLELDLSSSKLSLAQAAKYRTVAQAAYADIAVPCLTNCWVGAKRSSTGSLAAQADRAAEAAMKREEEAQQRQDAREVRSLYGVLLRSH